MGWQRNLFACMHWGKSEMLEVQNGEVIGKLIFVYT